MAKSRSSFFVDPLYSRMAEDLHLGGMSQRTHDGYLRAVRQLADFSIDDSMRARRRAPAPCKREPRSQPARRS